MQKPEILQEENKNKNLVIDFREQKACIFGIQGSGKTEFAKQACQKFKRVLVFQVNDDDDWVKLKNTFVYKVDPKNIKNIQDEFKKFTELAHRVSIEGKIDLIIIDEADLFIQTNYDLDAHLTDLIINHRHRGRDKRKGGVGVAIWLITRRPQDIPTKIVEQSKYNIIFALEGANAIDKFREINPELPDMIRSLDMNKHNYIIKQIGKPPVKMAPLKVEK